MAMIPLNDELTRRLHVSQLDGLGLQWFVTVADHINAGFIEEEPAKAHFRRAARNVKNLASVSIKLYRIGIDANGEPTLTLIVRSGQ